MYHTCEPGCPFCRANKKLRGEILYEGIVAYAVKTDEGNLLIIPRDHTENPVAMPKGWQEDFERALAEVFKREGIEQCNLSVNYGRAAGQTVVHLHWWVTPRHDGDGGGGKGLKTLLDAHKAAAAV